MSGPSTPTTKMTIKRRERKRKAAKSPTSGRAEGSVHPPPSNQFLLASTSLIFLLHALGLVFLFNPVAGIFNDLPVLDQDWGLHFHHLLSLEQFWRRDGQAWGYNPFFMAGYPSNTIQDLSIKFFEFSALLLSSLALASIQWFKILAILAVALLPWLAYFTARNLWHQDAVKMTAALSALLGTAYWWNSLPREMFYYGMLGFPIACYIALWGISLVYRMARQPSGWSRTHFGWLVFVLLFPALHVQSAIILAPALVALLIHQPRLLRTPLSLWVVGAALFSLLVNLVWLAPAFSHLKDDISGSIVQQLSLFASADPLTFVKDYLGPQHYWSFRSTWAEKGLRLMIVALGALGILQLLRSEQKALGVMLAAAAATLFLLAYFGSLFTFVKAWQPLRFKVALDLFLIFPAAYASARWLAERPRISYIVPVAWTFAVGAFFVNVMTTEAGGRMLLRTGIRPEIRAIIEWVQTETPANARVLFEESGDETGFVYDGMYLSSFVAHRTGRELIGGPINLYNDRHHFAEFHSGKLFKKEIHRLSDDEIKNYFRLYNIGAVVSFHPASIQRLQAVPGFVKIEQRIGPVHLMKVNQPLTWFLQGSGKVNANLNRIELRDIADDEIILKYHWTEGLTASPPARVIPHKLLDDPIPFIKIINPPTELILSIKVSRRSVS